MRSMRKGDHVIMAENSLLIQRPDDHSIEDTSSSPLSRRDILTRAAAGAATIIAASTMPGAVQAFAAERDARPAAKTLTIGAKDFSESQIVAYMYQLLLQQAGVPVNGTLKLNLPSDRATPALQRGDIDIFPEYTGTGVNNILGKTNVPHNAQAYFQAAKAGYQSKFKLTWLTYSPMNDAQGFATTQAVAKQYGLKSLTDVWKNASKLRLIVAEEYLNRADGLQGADKIYGQATFKQIVKIAGAGSLRYQALLSGKGDVVEAFTTDGVISGENLVVLSDPKGYALPDNLAPVVRDDALSSYPKIATVLNGLAPKITSAAITALNYQADVKGKNVQTLARTFLQQQGLLK